MSSTTKITKSQTLYARWKKASAKSMEKSEPPSEAQPVVLSPVVYGVYGVGGYDVGVTPDLQSPDAMYDWAEAVELASALWVPFEVSEGARRVQVWFAALGILADEDLVPDEVVDIPVADLGVWQWLRFFAEDGKHSPPCGCGWWSSAGQGGRRKSFNRITELSGGSPVLSLFGRNEWRHSR